MTSNNVGADVINVSSGGLIQGVSGILSAAVFNVSGGAIAGGGLTVNFQHIDQTGGTSRWAILPSTWVTTI